MASFWGMDATKTDRRHFFLIEKFNGDYNDISNALVSAGFQNQNDLTNEEIFTYGSGQVCFKRRIDNLDSEFFGGFIEPNEEMKQRALNYLKRFLVIGKLSFLLMIAYVLGWIIAFLAFFANSLWLFDILGFTIPFSFLFSIIAAALFVLVGLYFDTKSSLQNKDIVKHIIDPLISSLQSITNGLEIKKISIKTRINDRGVMKRLPSEFSEKIKALGIEQIDAFYWK